MKKISITLFLFLFIFSLIYAQPEITLNKKTHDFGAISDSDGRVSHKFVFTNTGNDSLIIKKVSSS